MFSSALFLSVAWEFQPLGTVSKSKERTSPTPWTEMNPKGKRLAGRSGLNIKHKAIGSIILASPCQMGTWKGRGRLHKPIKGRRKIQRKSSTPELVSKVMRFMQREFSENKKSTVDKEQQQNAYSLVR